MDYESCCCVDLLSTIIGFCDETPRCLEFRGVGVGDTVLMILSDAVRTGVLDVTQGKEVDGDELVVMTRENMMDMLNQMGKTAEDCQGECEVEFARNIGADFVISGEVAAVSMSLRLSPMRPTEAFCLLHRSFKRVTSNLIKELKRMPSDQQEGAEGRRSKPRKHQRRKGSKWSNTGKFKRLVCGRRR